MGFKSSEQLRDIIDGGVYSCGAHDFICDLKDKESIQKHEEDFPHTVSGTAICQRCKSVEVRFKGLPQPPMGREPGAFCDDCKKALVAEFQEGNK